MQPLKPALPEMDQPPSDPFEQHAVQCLRRIMKHGYMIFLAEELNEPSWPDAEWSRFIVAETQRALPELRAFLEKVNAKI